jgi:hypothetical protein
VFIREATAYWMPRLKRGMTIRVSAISRRDAPEFLLKNPVLLDQRVQGKPGARCTRSRAWCVESTRVSHHRFTGTPGLPCAMVLTAYFALSPVTGLVCHRRLADASATLDASVGASGPHDFAVRKPALSSGAQLASIASRPAFVTIASRPSVGRDGER